ncbi:MAG: 4-phosphoerythronate dehydrogenase [Fibrobacterota bacterium]
MKIIADKNIPFAEEAFKSFGTVTSLSESEITSEAVKDCDILLVRSVTMVNEDLLADSRVSFVGTVTIGTDHVDTAYLEKRGIGFASAPGSNARSVAEYVVTAITNTVPEYYNKKIGIVGVGNVGTAVSRMASALGMETILNDPPKSKGLYSFVSLEDLLHEADVVTVHVPLTYEGQYSTYGMVNDSFLSAMNDGAFLINTSRGKTLCEEPLISHADRLAGYILDVWPREPEISNELLSLAHIATPHIAGYSYDGKCMGLYMVYKAASAFFFQDAEWYPPVFKEKKSRFESIDYDPDTGIAGVLHQAYDIFADSQALKNMVKRKGDERIEYFRKLRKEYPRRYEFSHFSVANMPESSSDAKVLKSLGFSI